MVVDSSWNRYTRYSSYLILYFIQKSVDFYGSMALCTSLYYYYPQFFSGYIYGPCIFKVTLIVSLRLVNPALAVCTLLDKTVEVYSAVRTLQGLSLVKCLVVSSVVCKYKY